VAGRIAPSNWVPVVRRPEPCSIAGDLLRRRRDPSRRRWGDPARVLAKAHLAGGGWALVTAAVWLRAEGHTWLAERYSCR